MMLTYSYIPVPTDIPVENTENYKKKLGPGGESVEQAGREDCCGRHGGQIQEEAERIWTRASSTCIA